MLDFRARKQLEMWVEVLSPPQALASRPKVLRAPSALECELRVVLWGVHEFSAKGKSLHIQKVTACMLIAERTHHAVLLRRLC